MAPGSSEDASQKDHCCLFFTLTHIQCVPLSVGYQAKEMSGLSHCSDVLNPLLLTDRTDHFLFTVKTQKKAKPSHFWNYDLLTSYFTGSEKDNSLKERNSDETLQYKVWKQTLPCPTGTRVRETISSHLGLRPATSATLWLQQCYTASQNLPRRDCFFLSPQPWWRSNHLHQVHCLLLLLLLFYMPDPPKFPPLHPFLKSRMSKNK